MLTSLIQNPVNYIYPQVTVMQNTPAAVEQANGSIQPELDQEVSKIQLVLLLLILFIILATVYKLLQFKLIKTALMWTLISCLLESLVTENSIDGLGVFFLYCFLFGAGVRSSLYNSMARRFSKEHCSEDPPQNQRLFFLMSVIIRITFFYLG